MLAEACGWPGARLVLFGAGADLAHNVRRVCGCQGARPTVRVPQRRHRLDPDTGRYRPLSANQLSANQRTSTPPTPVNADRANAPTPS